MMNACIWEFFFFKDLFTILNHFLATTKINLCIFRILFRYFLFNQISHPPNVTRPSILIW